MNCRNCGAPLTGNRCEYCGTDYPELRTLGDRHEEVTGRAVTGRNAAGEVIRRYTDAGTVDAETIRNIFGEEFSRCRCVPTEKDIQAFVSGQAEEQQQARPLHWPEWLFPEEPREKTIMERIRDWWCGA